ncbi:MAG: DUF2617 family protein [Chloroflexi bacterium]|jgi:hypothetical protein|nr:DUF2617 family protein [Chloroflexota bacterium]
MSALQAIYQNPRDLRLFIWHGAAPERLSALREHSLCIGAWRITFRIIGESHWISAQHADAPPLHEVLACAELIAPMDAHQHAFKRLHKHTFSTADAGYRLRIAFKRQRTPASVPEDGLLVLFPPIFEQMAFTHIAWRVARDAAHIAWRTQHVYPQPEGSIIVTSVSRLALAQPPILASI